MNLNERIRRQMCRRNFHTFCFGYQEPSGEVVKFLYTKDEHRSEDAVQPFPDMPYLRCVADMYLLGGKFIDPEQAKYALDWGLPLNELQQIHQTGLLAIEKSRQVMVTWITLAYVLWRAKFFEHQLILVQSKREDDAQKLVCVKADTLHSARLTFLETHLPPYLQNMTNCTKCNVHFSSGSHVWGIPEGGAIIRSHTASLLFSDEAAFQPEFGEAYTAALPAIRGGGQAIFVSSAEIGAFQQIVEAKI